MTSLTAVREIAFSFRDFLFPPSCLLCRGTIEDDGILCSPCLDSLAVEAAAYPPPRRMIEGTGAVSALLPYHDRCRQIVHALKYHGMASLGPVAGRLMAPKTLRLFPVSSGAILVPVPLHPDRLRERGYNQSERLACGFASFSGHEIRTDILKRVRKTETQTHLSPGERQHNVLNAFLYSGERSLAGCDAVLIDDVLTTGSTIAACVRALRDGGVGAITISVLATPEPGND